MAKKFLLIIAVIFFGVVFAQNTECSSITKIIENRDGCHNTWVTVEGKVTDVKWSDDRKFVLFNLDDGFNIIQVGSNASLNLQNGITVRITGIFLKELRSQNYEPIFNTIFIESTDDVKVISDIKTNYLEIWQIVGLMFVIGIIGCVAIISKRKIENKAKGNEFEHFCIDKFDDEEWALVDYTKDVSKNVKRWTEASRGPDFIVRHKGTNKHFAIECKYKSSFIVGKKGEQGIIWAEPYKIRFYSKYSQEKNTPVYIMIGVEGVPKKVQNLFLLPLEKLQYPFATKTYLEKFKIDPNKKITLDKAHNISQ